MQEDIIFLYCVANDPDRAGYYATGIRVHP